MYRIGQGFDIHQLQLAQEYFMIYQQHKSLWLGGIKINDSPYIAIGHSDADCLLHAIIDALLGALSLGDIGQHFSDQDPKYKDVSSSLLLNMVYQKVVNLNYQIVNIDSTIILESPRLTDFISTICQNIANILQLERDKVSVKAKTHEKLDSLGQNRAVSAQAIVFLTKNQKLDL